MDRIADVQQIIKDTTGIAVPSHTLRRWDNKLKLAVRVNERGDRSFDETAIDALKLISKLDYIHVSFKVIQQILETPFDPGPKYEIFIKKHIMRQVVSDIEKRIQE